MRTYRINGTDVPENAENLSFLLERAAQGKERPLCMCCPEGVPMYVSRYDGQFIAKRMPSSGAAHNPTCESYEPPYELTGLGELVGEAIRIDGATGTSSLRLDFALSKAGTRAAPDKGEAGDDGSVKAEVKKLSLRALLHYLWHEGELTSWNSAWAGKRGWSRVRFSLQEAAGRMNVRSGGLSENLFVPEIFNLERKAEIAARRMKALENLTKSNSSRRKLKVLVARSKSLQMRDRASGLS